MAKIAFRKIRMNRANKIRLDQINGIIEEYQRQDYRLTLRQLYYQLVSRDVIPNKVTEYSKLSVLLREGRMGGIVDWNAIEDRLRSPEKPSSWDEPGDVLDSAARAFSYDLMLDQENYVEVWVEKDALSGVLSRVTEKYHIPILVNRGYSSASAMYSSYNRFSEATSNGQAVKILYLGDFDPSGVDMIRDVNDRVMEFFDGMGEEPDFEVKPIALTRAQIRQYNPPPNPAKIQDPRAGAYIEKYGNSSWEVDALKPEVLNQILTDNILSLIDVDKYNDQVEATIKAKAKLRAVRKYLR
jgi:hypothetical protein